MEELINKRVRHKAWGVGVIIETSDRTVMVDFMGTVKKFIYPDAFKRFLMFEEDDLQQNAHNLLEEKQKTAAEAKEAEERRLRIEEKLRQVERMRFEYERRSGHRAVRHDNPAFRGESVYTGDGVVRAGTDSGGRTRRFRGLEPNSLAILTAAGAAPGEENRVITAAFLIDDTFEGNEYREGYVKSSPTYRVELSGEEAESLRFSEYYKPRGAARWGTSLFRDIDDRTAARLLSDIVRVKSGTDGEDAAKALYDYFYKTHKYTIEG